MIARTAPPFSLPHPQAMDTEFDFGGEGEAGATSVPSSLKEMASVVEAVLTEAGVVAKRPSQLDIPDFVRYIFECLFMLLVE